MKTIVNEKLIPKIIKVLALSLFLVSNLPATAQVTIGAGIEPEKGALLDLKQKESDIENNDLTTASAGLLLPRVKLESVNTLYPVIDSTKYSVEEYEKYKKTHIGLVVYNVYKDESANLKSGTYQWDGKVWQELIDIEKLREILQIDAGGEKKLNIPSPAVFKLAGDITNFLNISVGLTQSIPMITDINSVPDYIQLSDDNKYITFEPGFYVIRLIYEATHFTDCTISSYFIDFPVDNYPSSSSRLRIHSTASHEKGISSSHGGIIMGTTLLTKTVKWNIHLGKGQSGNCFGTGNTLAGRSTLLYIERYNNEY